MSSGRASPIEPSSVLLLDEFGSHAAGRVVVCLGQERGMRVHVLAGARARPVAWSRYCASFHEIDRGATEEAKLERIGVVLARTEAQVLMPLVDGDWDLVVRNAARLSSMVTLPPLPSLASLEAVRHKDDFAVLLREHGLPLPTTVDARQVGQSVPRGLAYPVLWKPAVGSGGAGIRKFDDENALQSFLEERPSLGRGVLQAFVHGTDVDCSMLCRSGEVLAWTSQRSLVERRHRFGHDEALVFARDEQVLDLMQRLVRALDWNGVAHVDLRQDEQSGELYPVDFSPRFWKSLLGSLVAGVNFPLLWNQTARGLDFARPVAHEATYYRFRPAVRRLLRAWRPGPSPMFRVGESELGFALKDPLPVMFECVDRGRRWVRARRRERG